MSWFTDLTKTQQAEYIKKHPNSKYAKSKRSTVKQSVTRKAVPSPPSSGNGRTEYLALGQDLAFATSATEKARIKKLMELHKRKYNL